MTLTVIGTNLAAFHPLPGGAWSKCTSFSTSELLEQEIKRDKWNDMLWNNKNGDVQQ